MISDIVFYLIVPFAIISVLLLKFKGRRAAITWTVITFLISWITLLSQIQEVSFEKIQGAVFYLTFVSLFPMLILCAVMLVSLLKEKLKGTSTNSFQVFTLSMALGVFICVISSLLLALGLSYVLAYLILVL